MPQRTLWLWPRVTVTPWSPEWRPQTHALQNHSQTPPAPTQRTDISIEISRFMDTKAQAFTVNYTPSHCKQFSFSSLTHSLTQSLTHSLAQIPTWTCMFKLWTSEKQHTASIKHLGKNYLSLFAYWKSTQYNCKDNVCHFMLEDYSGQKKKKYLASKF